MVLLALAGGVPGWPESKEALIKSARADRERFCLLRKFGKSRNTVCISDFPNCTEGAKDPLLSRRRFIQRFPKSGSSAAAGCDGDRRTADSQCDSAGADLDNPVPEEYNHKEALNNSARAGSERFFPSRRFRKRWNTVCITRFLNRTDGGKDPLLSRRRIVQSFPRAGGERFSPAEGSENGGILYVFPVF